MTTKSLLLLTDKADAAAKWVRDLNQWETSVVIKPYHSGFPDDPGETFALVMVDLDGAAISQDGLDICCRLRTQMGNPILLLTYDRDETHLLRAYEAGVDAHITKPIAADLLLAQVNAWLYWTPMAEYPRGRVDSRQGGRTIRAIANYKIHSAIAAKRPCSKPRSSLIRHPSGGIQEFLGRFKRHICRFGRFL